MRGQDAARDHLSMSGDAEPATLPTARWEEHGAEDGRGPGAQSAGALEARGLLARGSRVARRSAKGARVLPEARGAGPGARALVAGRRGCDFVAPKSWTRATAHSPRRSPALTRLLSSSTDATSQRRYTRTAASSPTRIGPTPSSCESSPIVAAAFSEDNAGGREGQGQPEGLGGGNTQILLPLRPGGRP